MTRLPVWPFLVCISGLFLEFLGIIVLICFFVSYIKLRDCSQIVGVLSHYRPGVLLWGGTEEGPRAYTPYTMIKFLCWLEIILPIFIGLIYLYCMLSGPACRQGLSCEDCAPGYTRSGRGFYLGTCVKCSCNGKSTSCDPVTGTCLVSTKSVTGTRLVVTNLVNGTWLVSANPCSYMAPV